MGFLRFLKKEKPKLIEGELDVPPVPPSVEKGEDLGLTSIGEEIPPPPLLEEEKLPPFPSPVEEEREEAKPIEELIPKEVPVAEEEIRPPEKEEVIEEIKPIFVRAEKFKDILKEISNIKADLKKSENVIVSIDDLKDNKEGEFVKWHNTLDDIEKKLMLVDKILFKGD